MKLIYILSAVAATSLLGVATSHAEDLSASFAKIEKLVKSGDLPRALNELSWVRTDLEKRYQESVYRFFPDSLGEYRAVADGRLLMRSFANDKSPSRFYAKDPSAAPVRVSVVGNLEQISKFYSIRCENSIGNDERFRIGERSASLLAMDRFRPNEDKIPTTLTVCLPGGQVNFEGEDSASNPKLKNELKKLAELFKYDEIEKYLNGFK